MMSLCPTLVDVTDAPRSTDSHLQPTASTSVLPELKARDINQNKISCHLKDVTTQWIPGSAAAALQNEKSTNVPLDSQSALVREKQQSLGNQTKCSATGLKTNEVPLRLKLLNMISDDIDGGRKSKQKSPSELYAAFPLDGMSTVEKHTPDYMEARDESRHPRPQLQSGPSVQDFLLSRKGQVHQGKSVKEARRRPLSNHISGLQHHQQQQSNKKSSRESLFTVSALCGTSSLDMMNETQEADPSSPIFINNGQQVKQKPLFSPDLSTRWEDNPPSFSTERMLVSPTKESPPASVFKQPDFPPRCSRGFQDTQVPHPFLPSRTYSTSDLFTMCTSEKSAGCYGSSGCNGLPSFSTSRKELPTSMTSPSNTTTCLDEVILGEPLTPSLDQILRMNLGHHPIELEPIDLDFSSKLNLGLDFSPADFNGGFSPGLNTEELQFMDKTPDWNVEDVGMASAAAEEWVIDPPLTWDVTPSEEHLEGIVQRPQLHRPDFWDTCEAVARDITLDLSEPSILRGFPVKSVERKLEEVCEKAPQTKARRSTEILIETRPNPFTSRQPPTQGSMSTKTTRGGTSSSNLSFFDAYRFQAPSSPTSPLLYDKGQDHKNQTSGRPGKGSGRNVVFRPIEHRQSPRKGKGQDSWFEEKEREKDIFKDFETNLSPVASDPANVIIVCFPASEDVPTPGPVADSLSIRQQRGRGQKIDTTEPSGDYQYDKVPLSLGAPAKGFPTNQEFQSSFGISPDKVESTGDSIALPRPEESPSCMFNPSNKNRVRQMHSLGGSAIAHDGGELMALWGMQEVQGQSYKPPKARSHSADLTQGRKKNFQDGFQQLSVVHKPSDNKAEQCSSSNMWSKHGNYTRNPNLVYQEAYIPQEEIVKQVAKVQSTKKDKVGQERGLKNMKLNNSEDQDSCSKKAESPSHHHNIQMIVSNLPNCTDSGQDGKLPHQIPRGYQSRQLNISDANMKQGSEESRQRLVTDVDNSALGGSSPLQKGATIHFRKPTQIPRSLSFDQEIHEARQDRNKQGNKEDKLSFDELEPVRSPVKFQPVTEQPTQETRKLMDLLNTRTGLQKRKREENAPRSLFSELRDKMQLPLDSVNSTQFSKGSTLMELHDEVCSSPLRKQKRNTRPADEKHYVHGTNQAEGKENYAGISRESTAMEFIPVTASQPLGKQKGGADKKQDKQNGNLEIEEEHIPEGSKKNTALGVHTEMSSQPLSKRKRASSSYDEKQANKVADWGGQTTTCPDKVPMHYTLTELKDEHQQSRAVSSEHSGTPLMSDRNQTSPPSDRRQSHLHPIKDQVPRRANEKHRDEISLSQHGTKSKEFCLQPELKIGIEAIQKERETRDSHSGPQVAADGHTTKSAEANEHSTCPAKLEDLNEVTSLKLSTAPLVPASQNLPGRVEESHGGCILQGPVCCESKQSTGICLCLRL